MSGDARLSPEAVIIYNRAIDTDIEEVLANGVSGSSLEEAGVSAEIILDKATIEPLCPLHPVVSKPSPACLDREGHHGKRHAVPGVICKRGWSADSGTDQEMEVASQVYTRNAERIYEAKKSKTIATLC